MFDYLFDDATHPKVFLINCRLTERQLTSGLGFFSFGIRKGKTFDLFDRRNTKICCIELLPPCYGLQRDIVVTLSDEKFTVLETYA